jgi:simple sugar transport system permease protein
MILTISLLASTLRLATPLSLAAVGGYFSERSGTVNIALEGLMLIGAFGAAAGAHGFQNPWLGLLVGIATAVIFSAMHGYLCIHAKVDAIISGIAINFLAAGVPPVFAQGLYGYSGGTPQLSDAARLGEWPIGSPLMWLAALSVIGSYLLHKHFTLGQYIRFSGEHPQALEAQGVSVVKTRWVSLIICGVLCGLAGGYLAIDHGTAFSRNMTAGRGFIALAALIVGRHHPLGAGLAALVFGLIEATQILLQGTVSGLPVQALQALPYAATLVILAFGSKLRQN